MTDAYITLVILCAAVLLFITRWVNYTATALFVPLALYFTGVLEAPEILTGLTNGGCLLCAAMLIVGGTILASGLAKQVGDKIIYAFKTERATMAALMGTSILLSTFLSNMGTATIMVPLSIGVCQAKKEFRVSKLLLAVAFGCSLGGMNSLIGTPVNLLLNSSMEEMGMEGLSFFAFAKLGVPVCVAGLVYMYFFGYRMCPVTDVKVEEMAFAHDPDLDTPRTRRITGVVFVAIIISMCLEKVTGIPTYISAFLGVLVLFFTKTISDKQAYGFIEWPAVFLVAGMLPLASAMSKTGAASLVARWLMGLVGESGDLRLFLVLLFLVSFLLTQFMSNTAAASLLIPIGISIAGELKCNPMAVLMAIVVASQCAFATPIATPHNAYVMEMAGYGFKDFVKIGIPLSVLAFVVTVVLLPVVWKF